MIVKLLNLDGDKRKAPVVPLRRDPTSEPNRAYLRMEVKDLNSKTRTFKGIATTIAVDRYGDIVEASGAQYKLPVPLLWQHDSHQPVGKVTDAKESSKRITVAGYIAQLETPGTLKDRLDETWQSLELELVQYLSIGFRPLKWEYIPDSETYGIHFLEWEWLELSLVTIPANSDAEITALKRYDAELRRAASGTMRPSFKGVPLVDISRPGVSGIGGDEAKQRSKAAVKLLSVD